MASKPSRSNTKNRMAVDAVTVAVRARQGSARGRPAERAQRARAPADGFVAERHPPALAGVVHAELVVEAKEVLLPGRLGHHELRGDEADRRGFGEEVGRQNG